MRSATWLPAAAVAVAVLIAAGCASAPPPRPVTNTYATAKQGIGVYVVRVEMQDGVGPYAGTGGLARLELKIENRRNALVRITVRARDVNGQPAWFASGAHWADVPAASSRVVDSSYYLRDRLELHAVTVEVHEVQPGGKEALIATFQLERP